jgi:pSer/pThr/pTyr-binding forkhead associated (FHA) protein
VPATSAITGLPIDLEIHDAKGTRNLRITQFPFILGRKVSMPQHAIEGTFVSRKHGILERDAQQRVWFSDTSVNGSALDGVHTLAGERHPLRNGAVIVLGGDGAVRAECPAITIRWSSSDVDENTPLRKPISQTDDGMSTPLRTPLNSQDVASGATPMTAHSSSATSRALCMLAIQDAHGSHTVAVTRLPFVIGRDAAADCRLPEANEGVSRTHLVMLSVDVTGARLHNSAFGKWGTEVKGVEQPQEFALAWGQQITLARRYAKTPPVTLQLLAPAL